MLNISNVLIKLNCTILFIYFSNLSGRWPNGWAPLLGRGVRSSNLHCLMPTRLPIIILSIMLVMEIRHSLQILDLLKFESPLLDICIYIMYIYNEYIVVMEIRHSNEM